MLLLLGLTAAFLVLLILRVAFYILRAAISFVCGHGWDYG